MWSSPRCEFGEIERSVISHGRMEKRELCVQLLLHHREMDLGAGKE